MVCVSFSLPADTNARRRVCAYFFLPLDDKTWEQTIKGDFTTLFIIHSSWWWTKEQHKKLVSLVLISTLKVISLAFNSWRA